MIKYEKTCLHGKKIIQSKVKISVSSVCLSCCFASSEKVFCTKYGIEIRPSHPIFEPVQLTLLQPGSSSLLYGKSSNEPAPRQLVFNPEQNYYCLIFWLLHMRQPVSDPG